MATITVKDIPDDLYAALKKKAAVHHRSVNREVIHYIEQAVLSREVNVDAILDEARRIREQIGAVPFSEELLNDYKNAGRL